LTPHEAQRHVPCEINVNSVSTFPLSARLSAQSSANRAWLGRPWAELAVAGRLIEREQEPLYLPCQLNTMGRIEVGIHPERHTVKVGRQHLDDSAERFSLQWR
jgi:hypothetical protein